MDIDEYVCPGPPTIVKRKKSVSRISGCSKETRLSSSLFSLPSDEEDFDEVICFDDMISEKNTMDMSPPSLRLQLHDHDGGLDFDRISPTSVMEVLYHDPRDHPKRSLPPVPDLVSSFSSDESCSIATPGTPSPRRNREKIQKWSSFHEHGRDWGTSEPCDATVTQDLLDLLAMMEEEEEENLQDK